MQGRPLNSLAYIVRPMKGPPWRLPRSVEAAAGRAGRTCTGMGTQKNGSRQRQEGSNTREWSSTLPLPPCTAPWTANQHASIYNTQDHRLNFLFFFIYCLSGRAAFRRRPLQLTAELCMQEMAARSSVAGFTSFVCLGRFYSLCPS